MEISTLANLTELGMDHSLLHQWQMGSVDELCPLSMAASFNDNYYYDMNLYSIPFFNPQQQQPESNVFETAEINRPSKQQKTNSWGSSSITAADHLFDSTSPSSVDTQDVPKSKYPTSNVMKPKMEINFSSCVSPSPGYSFNTCHGTKRDRSSSSNAIPSKLANAQARDHVLAERRRRENLSQKFIALSALLPGLKKMDKASILGDCIKYLKTLEEKVSKLEDQTKNPKTESLVFVEKHHKLGGSTDSEAITKPLQEIEARFAGKDVLIRIHCEKRKRILEKIVAEVEKFPLSAMNSSALSFGTSALDITIIAQMEEGFNMSIKEFVKKLDFQLQSLIGKYSKQEDTFID